ncbi:hypothetical protein R3P38DRAFT_3207477 [Favolaschia claudopus]|uniref:Uncharacterized protein n=1 Tax=Favolaschia claudopus TaxID=2862362 RepID=A0AAW0ALB2_9AGAR
MPCAAVPTCLLYRRYLWHLHEDTWSAAGLHGRVTASRIQQDLRGASPSSFARVDRSLYLVPSNTHPPPHPRPAAFSGYGLQQSLRRLYLALPPVRRRTRAELILARDMDACGAVASCLSVPLVYAVRWAGLKMSRRLAYERLVDWDGFGATGMRTHRYRMIEGGWGDGFACERGRGSVDEPYLDKALPAPPNPSSWPPSLPSTPSATSSALPHPSRSRMLDATSLMNGSNASSSSSSAVSSRRDCTSAFYSRPLLYHALSFSSATSLRIGLDSRRP